jgi:hypothetical protein
MTARNAGSAENRDIVAGFSALFPPLFNKFLSICLTGSDDS